MTEQEAKTKWCPQSFQAGERGTLNADNHRFIMRCIGSACMAWRWDDVPNPEYERQMQGMLAYSWPKPPMTFKSDTCGHCGLAGKP